MTEQETASPYRINTLKISNFRGIKSDELVLAKKNKKGKGSIVICGSNGTGKSSYVNALEFLFTGKVSHLYGKKDIKYKESLPFHGSNPEDSYVEASFPYGGHIKRTLNTNNFEVSENIEPMINRLSNGSFLLNRKKLLNFIDATQGERFNAISHLLGLDDLSDTEKFLRQGKKEFENRYKIKKEEYDNSIRDFETLISSLNSNEKKISSFSEGLNAMNIVLKTNNISPIDSKNNLNNHLDDLEQDFIQFKINEYIEEFVEYSMNIDIESFKEYFSIIEENYKKCSLNELKDSSKLLSILKDSQNYILSEDSDSCPICERELNDDIRSKLSIRISDLKKTNSLFEEWRDDVDSYIQRLNNLSGSLSSLDSKIKDLNKALDKARMESIKISFSEDISNIRKFIEDLKKSESFEMHVNDINSTPFESLENNIDAIINEFNQILKNLEKSETSKVNVISDCLYKLSQIKNLEEDLGKLVINCKMAQDTYVLFKESKECFIKEKIENIADEISEYYNFIHESDKILNPSIKVIGSNGLKLLMNCFEGDEVDPRSFSSEGHLDTLGFCIFLASVKKFNGDFKLIVLDDIIATVDLEHKDKIITLLHEKFDDYQILITTHNRLWFKQIQATNEMYNNSKVYENRFKFDEIIYWSELDGPVRSEFKPDKQKINGYLNPEHPDMDAAGNAIRRYLEEFLNKLSGVYEIKYPIKPHYMVEDYFNATSNQILEKVECSEVEEYYAEKFNNLRGTRFMSNYLSHFNQDSNFFTYDELCKFRDTVFDLEKSFKCDKCGKFLIFDKSKIHCSNKCMEKIKLIPPNER